MYMNILVPVSFDEERDAKQAIDVAKTLSGEGAHITLLHVVEQVGQRVAPNQADQRLRRAHLPRLKGID